MKKEKSAVKKLFVTGMLAAVIAFGVTASQAGSKIVVGYYYPGGTPSYTYTTIRYDCLTHIAHAFIEPTASGALDVSGGFLYPQLNQRAHEKGVKVVVSLGGYGAAQTAAFVAMAADTAARHRFVQNLKTFCLTNKYDGADIDWEYPYLADKANYTALIKELRAAFNTVTPALTLSAAVSAYPGAGYDFAALVNDFDWVGVMTYDFYGTWTTKAGPNSPLYGTYSTTDQGWIDNTVANYSAKGISGAKLLIGIPFYGWQYNTSTLYGTPTTGATQRQYWSFIGNLSSGWTRTWDAATRTPYMTGAGKMISYDDSQSVAEKCEYIKSKNIGGAIVWAIGQDYTYPSQPLLETIGERLFNVTGVSAEHDNAQTPQEFALAQNYPNPFNPSTRIGFALPERAHVKLSIFNVLGQTVATLIDGEMAEGAHEVEWNAAGVPSGVYYCRITAAGSSRVIAMVLQK